MLIFQYVLLFFHVLSTCLATITDAALCRKKVGGQCPNILQCVVTIYQRT